MIHVVLLTSSGDSQAGADDFLPHLIYILIKANPPHLASNMEYVSILLSYAVIDPSLGLLPITADPKLWEWRSIITSLRWMWEFRLSKT